MLPTVTGHKTRLTNITTHNFMFEKRFIYFKNINVKIKF